VESDKHVEDAAVMMITGLANAVREKVEQNPALIDALSRDLAKNRDRLFKAVRKNIPQDPKRRSAGRRSRGKGNANEVEAAKTLCECLGLSPWREHLPTSRDIVGGNQQQHVGDLIPVSDQAKAFLEPFAFIEVKARKAVDAFYLINSEGTLCAPSVLLDWINTARAKNRTPSPELLILKIERVGFIGVFAWQPFTMVACYSLMSAMEDGHSLAFTVPGGERYYGLPLKRLGQALYWKRDTKEVQGAATSGEGA